MKKLVPFLFASLLLLSGCAQKENSSSEAVSSGDLTVALDAINETPTFIDGDIDGDDVVIPKVGDINADGSVDVKDLVRLMKYISGADVTICGSDVNGDGVTDTRDLVRLMRIIAAA